MDTRLALVPLAHAEHEPTYGGKAVSLGAALRAGLPVPPGVALAAALVDRVAAADDDALRALLASEHVPVSRLAVRSSAVGEDSHGASFAGQHTTRLNVAKAQLVDAVRMVWASARTSSALAYRARKGVSAEPRMGVVVQAMIEPVSAGVLFTRNPMTGADERLIESAWGLGEAVVNGAVTPDRFVLDRHGRVLDRTVGEKHVKVWYADEEGTIELLVPEALRTVPSLTDVQLAALHDLAERCRSVWGPDLDLEWALGADNAIYLLQSRPITTLRT